MPKLVLDFETASYLDLKVVGAARYSEDFTTEIISLAYKFQGEKEIFTWIPGNDLQALCSLAGSDDVLFVAHNTGFEKNIWRNIMVPVFGLPDIPNDRWEDTAATCCMKAVPSKLELATLALRLTVHKDKEGNRITKSLSKPNKKGFYNREPAILERVYQYNRQDVYEQEELLARIGSLPDAERKVWLLDQTINERGIGLDMDFIAAAADIVDQASIPLIEEFKEITGGLKPTQTVKLKAWVNANGVKVDSLAKEILEKLIGTEGEDDESADSDDDDTSLDIGAIPDNVRRALVIRSLVGSASVKKLVRMQRCVCLDGRARGVLQYHGAGPGRWAGRLFQPHNFPRGTIQDTNGDKPRAEILVPLILSRDASLVETVIGAPIETIVSSLRHSIKAGVGKTYLSGDYVGIELRVVLALAGQYDKAELLAQGFNLYVDMAQNIYKRKIEKKKDLIEYQIGKNAVLGLGFQMGAKKFRLKYAATETVEFCENVVQTYRKEWAPKVPKAWYGLQDAAIQTVHTHKPHSAFGVEYRLEDGWLTARLPSGRKLWYWNPIPTRRPMPWDDTDIRNSFSFQQTKNGRLKTVEVFGGLLTENVVQGLARDILVNAMFKLEENGFPIILTVHDEIVCEPDIENADEKAFKQIMEERPDWVKHLQIPIEVETWMADRYKK